MNKSIVFISHITQEADLALKLKELIEGSFLGMIEVLYLQMKLVFQRVLDGLTILLNH